MSSNPFDLMETSEDKSNKDEFLSASNQAKKEKKNNFVDPITGICISSKDMDAREEELKRKEDIISSYEEKINNGEIAPQKNNFPPYINLWSWYPERDLPENSVYLINWIGCLSCLSSNAAKATSSPATKIVLSSIYLFAFCPLSFEASLFVIYDSLMYQKALKFLCSLITYLIWLGFLCYNLIGKDDSGSVGLIQFLNFISSPGTGWVSFISFLFCLLGILLVIVMIYTLYQLFNYYKNQDFEKKIWNEGIKYAVPIQMVHKEENQHSDNNKITS